MTSEELKACNIAIHTASVAAGAEGGYSNSWSRCSSNICNAGSNGFRIRQNF